MPIISDISLALDMNQVIRREGIREYSNLRPEIKTLIRELLISVRKLRLLEPAIAYEIYPVTETTQDRLCLRGNIALYSPLFPSVLSEAEELATIVCTIGPRLETKVADYFAENDPLRAILLDGIGSAAVDSLTQEVCKVMIYEASSRGYETGSSLSPGMLGFPISEQWRLFELMPAEQIGVSLTSSGMMVPRKSLSMVIGIGPRMPTWTQAEFCTHCSLRKTCTHRIYASAKKQHQN
jgi:cobalamin-dependent methionine synthase I